MSSHPGINTALLNFCTSLDNGPKTNTAPPPQRTPEELQWLKEALASVEAPERTIRRDLTIITNADTTEEECITALEEMSELVEDINWAIEFSLMSGHHVILEMLRPTINNTNNSAITSSSTSNNKNNISSNNNSKIIISNTLALESSQVRQSAAMVIAHASQLNERVQKCFEEAQWHNILIPLLQKEENPAVLAAVLHSCSCLCRDYIPNAQLFSQAGGVQVLTSILSVNDNNETRRNDKIIRRALFLVSYLVETLTLNSSELIQCVCQHAENGNEEVQIAAARALLSFANKSLVEVWGVMGEISPECLSRWRGLALEEDDCRKQLLEKLDKEGHEG